MKKDYISIGLMMFLIIFQIVRIAIYPFNPDVLLIGLLAGIILIKELRG